MTLEGLTNPRLKGALTRQEFKVAYSKHILFKFSIIKFTPRNIKDREFLVDGKVNKDNVISYLYNEYLEAYKYDEVEYKKWLERMNPAYIKNIKDSCKPFNDMIDDMLGIEKKDD